MPLPRLEPTKVTTLPPTSGPVWGLVEPTVREPAGLYVYALVRELVPTDVEVTATVTEPEVVADGAMTTTWSAVWDLIVALTPFTVTEVMSLLLPI